MTLVALMVLWPTPVVAQSLYEIIPTAEPNCAIESPSAAAGIAATPGGFVMVHPRNDALTKQYTGCKIMWVINDDRFPRMATLYFKSGQLVTAAAHNVRDASGALDAACAFPEGKSLLPNAGRQIKDAGCRGLTGESFYNLYLPTWPRSCLADPKATLCQQDPR